MCIPMINLLSVLILHLGLRCSRANVMSVGEDGVHPGHVARNFCFRVLLYKELKGFCDSLLSVHIIEDHPNQADDILSLCQPMVPGARKDIIKYKNTSKGSDVMLLYHDRTKHMVNLTAIKRQNLNKDDNDALPFSLLF